MTGDAKPAVTPRPRERRPNADSPRLPASHRLGGLLCVALALAGVSLLLLGLAPGVALGLGVGVGLVGWALPGEYAFASGHLGAAIVLPSDPGLVALCLLEISLWMLLVLESRSRRSALRLGAFGCGIATLSTVFGWTLLSREPSLWTAGLAIAGVTAAALYGVHRYELVRLGIATETEP